MTFRQPFAYRAALLLNVREVNATSPILGMLDSALILLQDVPVAGEPIRVLPSEDPPDHTNSHECSSRDTEVLLSPQENLNSISMGEFDRVLLPSGYAGPLIN